MTTEERKLIAAIERAERNGDYEKASELTQELLELQNEPSFPSYVEIRAEQ